ncbi:hypothetical protein ACFQE8_02400 [Salinirubellus sp. GCM10025818]|uniref:hypothetical protein n=1 Tax=Salinirubellus TaxID=2162630 RepID=UPI0030CEDE3E
MTTPPFSRFGERRRPSSGIDMPRSAREAPPIVVPRPIREHVEDNWRARTLELTDADVESLDAIGRTERQYSPDYAPDW